MKNATTLFWVPFLAVAGLACGGGGGGGSGGSGGNVTCSGTSLTAKEANNYSFTSTLALPVIKVAPGKELSFDWSGVTADFLGHAITQQDLNMISILFWKLSQSDLEAKLNADTLEQNDLVVVPLSVLTDGTTPGVAAGATSAKLFNFTLNGNAIDSATILSYFDASFYTPTTNFTYTMMAATGTVPGQNVKMIQAFQLDPSSTNTSVAMTSSSTKLQSWSADLHSLTPVGVPAGQKTITLDWSTMTKTALGGVFDPTSVTHALVGHYTQTPAELEKQFLDIQLIATDLYQADISIGTTLDFSTMSTTGGKPFSGIDATGTWVVALQCGICHNPAPWYLSILKPCS